MTIRQYPHVGRLQPIAASVSVLTLYVARTARYGLLRPTCRLACYAARWDEACDRQLLQLIRYIHFSYELRQVGWVGDPIANVSLHVYADADLAGDAATQRSTTGVRLTLQGRNTSFPLYGASSRQRCVACSTPEAEIVCGHYAHKNLLAPAMDLWTVLFPSGFSSVFHEDNQAMIQVIKTGRTPHCGVFA